MRSGVAGSTPVKDCASQQASATWRCSPRSAAPRRACNLAGAKSQKIKSRRSYLTSEKLGKLSSRVGCVIRAISSHSTDSPHETYESAGAILIWLVALRSTPHRLIWTLFAGVMGFFVGGSFLAALQTPLSTNGAARQTTQTDTSEPIPSRPVDPPPISAPARPRNKHKRASARRGL